MPSDRCPTCGARVKVAADDVVRARKVASELRRAGSGPAGQSMETTMRMHEFRQDAAALFRILAAINLEGVTDAE